MSGKLDIKTTKDDIMNQSTPSEKQLSIADPEGHTPARLLDRRMAGSHGAARIRATISLGQGLGVHAAGVRSKLRRGRRHDPGQQKLSRGTR